MIFIIGGMGQGKLEYAKRICNATDHDVAQTPELGGTSLIVAELSQWIRAHEHARDILDQLMAQNPDVVLICNEVGCGVVPILPEERHWREQVGHICIHLAAKAQRVERIFCGIPMTLKGR